MKREKKEVVTKSCIKWLFKYHYSYDNHSVWFIQYSNLSDELITQFEILSKYQGNANYIAQSQYFIRISTLM